MHKVEVTYLVGSIFIYKVKQLFKIRTAQKQDIYSRTEAVSDGIHNVVEIEAHDRKFMDTLLLDSHSIHNSSMKSLYCRNII